MLLTMLDAIIVIRLCFIGAGISVLVVSLVPAFHDRFLAYGARSASAGSSAQLEKRTQQSKQQQFTSLLDAASIWRVPHSWFTSFYVTSVSLSIFWLFVLPTCRHSLGYLHPHPTVEPSSTPFSRQSLANILLLVQGVRRLAECILLQSSSASTMWIGHWLVGLGFYIGMSVAIWIEGLPALIEHNFSIHHIEIKATSFRTFCCLLSFTLASGIQHDCHAYLASLKRSKAAAQKKTDGTSNDSKHGASHYQMPTHPAFNTTVTPHYFAECVIYSALTVLTAPEGRWINVTVLCATLFVAINLGVTAVGTRKWYAETFGTKAVQGRWAMIPFIL